MFFLIVRHDSAKVSLAIYLCMIPHGSHLQSIDKLARLFDEQVKKVV